MKRKEKQALPWEVIHGACEPLIAKTPDDTYDAVVTSPPYGNARAYGELEFKLKGEKYVAWMVGIIKGLCRITKGPVIVNIQDNTEDYRWNASPVLIAADLHRAGIFLRTPCIFYRNGISGSGGKDYLRNDWEFCLVFSKTRGRFPHADNTACGSAPKYAPGGAMSHRVKSGKRVNEWGGSPHTKHRRRNGELQPQVRPNHTFGKMKEGEAYFPPKLANPGSMVKDLMTAEDVGNLIPLFGQALRLKMDGLLKNVYSAEEVAYLQNLYAGEKNDVLHLRVGGGMMGHVASHDSEAPFPVGLPDFFIRTLTQPGDKIYDPFGGSGTTLHAAIEAGRIGVMTEIREDQCKVAIKRCQGLTPGLYTENLTPLAKMEPAKRNPEHTKRFLAQKGIQRDLFDESPL